MNRTLRFIGLLLASLTISTVAMAQQNGGGHGGDAGGRGGEGSAGGGDPSVLQLLRDDEARKARLSRAVEPRGGRAHCISGVCSEPPPTRRPPARVVLFYQNCSGGEVFLYRGRGDQIIRRPCESR